MRKILIFLFCLAAVFTYGQKQFRVYGVGFYNQENLFDTCHDEGKNDYEYLPNGANRWGEMKYKNKVIKEQALLSILLIVAHILLMRFWAF